MSLADYYNELTNDQAIQTLRQEGVAWNPKKS